MGKQRIMKGLKLFVILAAALTISGLTSISIPPQMRTIHSPKASHKLALKRSIGIRDFEDRNLRLSLYKWNGKDAWAEKWYRSIDRWPGPRFVLVSEQGQVVFVDDWSGIPKFNGLKVYDDTGELVLERSAGDVVELAGCSWDEALERGQFGGSGRWWHTQTPNWREPKTVGIYVCGKSLELSLDPVRLTRAED